MPTYDYQCHACGHTFEKFQAITAPAVRKCPACGTTKVKRLIGTGAGVIFKGQGFYQTDYRSDSYKKEAAKEEPATETSSDKSADKSADKPRGKSSSSGNSVGD